MQRDILTEKVDLAQRVCRVFPDRQKCQMWNGLKNNSD